MQEVCSHNSWSHPSSPPSSPSHPSSFPLVWRELLDRGGKGLYLGGLSEFEQYARHYYDVVVETDTLSEQKIAAENLDSLKALELERQTLPKVEPLRLCITNATSETAYHLASQIARGGVGGEEALALQLLDSADNLPQLEGIAMELTDLAAPHLVRVQVTSSIQEALNSVSIAFILDYPHQVLEQRQEEPASSNQEENRELASSALRYHQYATTLDFCGQKDVKVILSGKYANTGAAIMARAVTSIPRTSFVASPSLVEAQARSILAQRLDVNTADVRQVAIWGRTHGTVLSDPSHTRVHRFKGAVVGPESFSLPVKECIFEKEWLSKEFPVLLAARHRGMEGYRSNRCPLSEAVGLVTLARDWCSGGGGEEWRSIGVVCEGGEGVYGIPEGLVFSVPVRLCEDGEGGRVWRVEKELDIDKEMQVRWFMN